MQRTGYELEKAIGLEYYLTDSEGVGGVLRQRVEDFQVREISSITPAEKGEYLIAELTKRDWDSHKALREIARRLHIAQNRIGVAGTKDKRAQTTQIISIWNASEEDIGKISISDITIKPLGYANRRVVLGDLHGNEFSIIIRNIPYEKEQTSEFVGRTIDQMTQFGGAPNYFSFQRFGITRPITHIVGEKILRGDIEGAAWAYIAQPGQHERDDTRRAREQVQDSRDYAHGLELMTKYLRYERAMLDYLNKNPGDYRGSFGVLPANLRAMFVHAYQSYLFNKMLSRRIERGLPLNSILVGDIVCFNTPGGWPDISRAQQVTEKTIDGIKRHVVNGRAHLILPLVGHQTALSEGAQGEIEQKILEEEQISPEDFEVKEAPEFGSKGSRRVTIMKIRDISLNAKHSDVSRSFAPQDILRKSSFCKMSYGAGDDELNPGKVKGMLSFTLQSGAYATSVLREIMKTDPLDMK